MCPIPRLRTLFWLFSSEGAFGLCDALASLWGYRPPPFLDRWLVKGYNRMVTAEPVARQPVGAWRHWSVAGKRHSERAVGSAAHPAGGRGPFKHRNWQRLGATVEP